jgi:hypothetical protein
MMNRRLCIASICTAVALGGIVMVGTAGTASAAPANPPVSRLTLMHGWVSENGTYSSGNPAVAVDGNGVVHLSGSMGGGTSDTEAFALPSGDAPASNIYINTYTLNGSVGYLIVSTSGAVFPVGSDVSGYTDLAGISFPSAGSGLPNLYPTLENAWASANPTYGTGDPAAALDSEGVVHLSGSLESGTAGDTAFVLPKADRPSSSMWLETYTFGGSTGYVFINTAGDVVPEGTDASDYTNLAGITFRAKSSILAANKLTMENGWTGNSFSAGNATVTRDQYGVVHLTGGITASSGNGPAFTLPSADRPNHYLYETDYTFGGTTGTVAIYPNGDVYLYGQSTSTTGVSTADEFASLTSITFEVKV